MYLYYEYVYRGHYSTDGWSIPYPQYYVPSDSEYTLIPFQGMPSKGQVDIRVCALVGTLTRRMPMLGFESGDRAYYQFDGIYGDYCTITVSSDLIVSTSPPSSSPEVPVSPVTSGIPTTLNPTNSSPQQTNLPSQQTPLQYTLLIVIVSICVIAILLVIISHLYSKQRKLVK